MNIQDLPSEILEKILIEGNFLSVSRVCQKWYELAQKIKFKVIYFDLLKDNPEEIKNNLNIVFLYNSCSFDRNGLCFDPHLQEFYHIESFMLNTYWNFLRKISNLNTLNFIFDPLIFIKNNNPCYILSKKLFADKTNHQTFGKISSFLYFIDIKLLKDKVKIVNIEIKDICNRIVNIDVDACFDNEIFVMNEIIIHQTFIHFKTFTIKGPNNMYLIYDENKKILIIRFGNYEKYNFPINKISICQQCSKKYKICSNKYHKQYFINCFSSWGQMSYLNNHYPAILNNYKFEKLLNKKIEKLIIVTSVFHDFMFDQLL